MCRCPRTLVLAAALPLLGGTDEAARMRDFPVAPDESYAVSVSIAKPEALRGNVRVEVRDAKGIVAAKTLQPFDLDLTIDIRPRGGPLTVITTGDTEVRVAPLHLARSGVVATGPNATWQTAQEIEAGKTVYGSSDERPYAPSDYAELTSGFQWFRFTMPAGEAKLAHFLLETPDRDVPLALDIFVPSADGGIEPYNEGASPYTPEATQNFPGLTPFRSRILHPGATYYIRVAANHPEFKLRTLLYPAPPYGDPRLAVRSGMDFLIALGDAWHANTPRRGAVAQRDAMNHAETSACIACHPTQFTLRGYLTAAENGYAVHHPAQVRFLAERLANNPRPLYGEPGQDWARVIFSARTVASRVPLLLDMVRRETGENFGDARGFAEYLRGTNLEDEADGSLPFVSAFEIGLQSWQTYRLMGWNGGAAAIETEIRKREPKNVIDLAWKIAALAKMSVRDDKLIDELYSWQDDQGRFPYPFDRKAAPADFITYQAMYALAVAGRHPETDPRLARTVTYALAHQHDDGSWQGDPVYKGFNTPFRDTQSAVMGLSTLFPVKPEPPKLATSLRTGSLDLLLEDLDAASPELQPEARKVVENSPWPLARSVGAAFLGNQRSADSIPVLQKALGDPSKLVQRSAAQALRRIGVDHPKEISSALIAALDSSDGRTRWGALRVFAQEFRSLTASSRLLAALRTELARDPAAQNRFQAANALWRWSQWQHDSSALDALANQLGEERNASVRRGLIESVYNIIDENGGLLDAWERAMVRPEDRTATEAAFHIWVAEWSRVVARNLEHGNRDLRMGLLTALWDFHLRHSAIPEDNRAKVDVILPAFFADYSAGVPRLHEPDFQYQPYAEAAGFRYGAQNEMHVTRLGNDADLPRLFADSGTELERAILKCLDGADREMKVQVIKAGSVLGDAATPAFTRAMLQLAATEPAVTYVYSHQQRGKLTLGSPDQPDAELQQQVARLIDSRQPETLGIVLPLLAELPVGSPFTRDEKLSWSVEKLLREDKVSGEALRAAAVFADIADTPLMRTDMLQALQSGDRDARRAAVDLVLSRYVTDPTTNELSRQFIDAMQPEDRAALIDKLDPSKFALRLSAASSYRAATGGEPLPEDDNLFSSPVVREVISDSLHSNSDPVRQAAIDIAREQPKLGLSVDAAPRTTPDFNYFAAKIQPILAARGADGKACVMCHASHAIFKLSLNVRENYTNALKVIDTTQPRRSLLLIKPTRPNDAAGDANLYLSTHNGGERWPGNEDSPEYQILLNWIRGEKAAPADTGPRQTSIPPVR
jgi:hypothetical protein